MSVKCIEQNVRLDVVPAALKSQGSCRVSLVPQSLKTGAAKRLEPAMRVLRVGEPNCQHKWVQIPAVPGVWRAMRLCPSCNRAERPLNPNRTGAPP
jgi:hypothetical protein